jgi:hypothetical protein
MVHVQDPPMSKEPVVYQLLLYTTSYFISRKSSHLTSNSFLASGNLSLSTESTMKTTASTPEVEYSLHKRLAAVAHC